MADDNSKKEVSADTPEPFTAIGVSGLSSFGGQIDEEKLTQLKGDKGPKQYRQMSDNDPVIGSIMLAVENFIRQVKWNVVPASQDSADLEAAQFVTECRDDMEHTWASFISDTLSFLTYGWFGAEEVYKTRSGPDNSDPASRSRFSDGKIGWRKLAGRSQESLNRWEFNDDGDILGWWQDTDKKGTVFLPIEKMLQFRTTTRKNNPEGKSLLRNAFISWYRKKEIERIESIGIERDLGGLPVMTVPQELLDSNADPATKSALEEYKKILRNVRNDEQMGVMIPAMYDDDGNKTLTFELLGTPGKKQIDTNQVILRYSKAIAMSVLADIVMMGHDKVGSFALASSKTKLFSVALGAYIQEIESVLNRHAIPRLLRLNGMQTETPPQFKASDVEKPELDQLFGALQMGVASGGIVLGSEDDEKWLREMLNMPELQEGFELDREERDTSKDNEEEEPLEMP